MVERERECRHELGFLYARYSKPVGGILGTFTCRIGCGYCLNFDPDLFCEGIAIVESTKKPKELPELVHSK